MSASSELSEQFSLGEIVLEPLFRYLKLNIEMELCFVISKKFVSSEKFYLGK